MNSHLRIENKAKHGDVCSHTDQHEKAGKAELFQWIVASQKDFKRYYSSLTLVSGVGILRLHLACVLKAQMNEVSSLDRLSQCPTLLKV